MCEASEPLGGTSICDDCKQGLEADGLQHAAHVPLPGTCTIHEKLAPSKGEGCKQVSEASSARTDWFSIEERLLGMIGVYLLLWWSAAP